MLSAQSVQSFQLLGASVPAHIVHAIDYAKFVALLLKETDDLGQCLHGGAFGTGVVHKQALNVVGGLASRAHDHIDRHIISGGVSGIKVPVHELVAAIEERHAQTIHKLRVAVVFFKD